jgi:glycosyltransferase involved in cell wall biosynthesis
MKKQKVVIVLPAYNAEKTLLKTYKDIPNKYRKNIILVDDSSNDKTVAIAKKLKIQVFVHKKNLGYGGNQKTCYQQALKLNPDIVIMLHPDYQYDPKLIPALVAMIESGNYDVVLGSRILGGGALKGGMPLYKYVSNRFLTFFENLCTGKKLSEYHTGLRAYKAEVLKNVNFQKNSNDFIFDNQILLQIIAQNYRIGEISCPTKYFKEASSINFIRSLKYGFGCVYWSIIYFLGKIKIYHHPLIFKKK